MGAGCSIVMPPLCTLTAFPVLTRFDLAWEEPSMEAIFRGVPSALTLERAEIAAVAAAAAVRSVRHDGDFVYQLEEPGRAGTRTGKQSKTYAVSWP